MSDHIKLRIKFSKSGAIRYIGHLDVMRFFQKCNRRADIDVCFTTGFSPHQIMSFASPLSVGLESNGEYMDIEVNSITSSKDMIQRMNEASVPGIQILSVKKLPEDAGNAMASVAAAEYTVKFRPDRIPAFFQNPAEKITSEIHAFLEMETIPYVKESKKGTREINLKDGIFRFSMHDDSSLHMLLDASSAGNIKPVQVLDAFLALHDDFLPENCLLVTREDTYTRIETETGEKLVSMDDIGISF